MAHGDNGCYLGNPHILRVLRIEEFHFMASATVNGRIVPLLYDAINANFSEFERFNGFVCKVCGEHFYVTKRDLVAKLTGVSSEPMKKISGAHYRGPGGTWRHAHDIWG